MVSIERVLPDAYPLIAACPGPGLVRAAQGIKPALAGSAVHALVADILSPGRADDHQRVAHQPAADEGKRVAVYQELVVGCRADDKRDQLLCLRKRRQLHFNFRSAPFVQITLGSG